MYNFIRPTEVILMEGKANKTAFLVVGKQKEQWHMAFQKITKSC